MGLTVLIYLMKNDCQFFKENCKDKLDLFLQKSETHSLPAAFNLHQSDLNELSQFTLLRPTKSRFSMFIILMHMYIVQCTMYIHSVYSNNSFLFTN